MISKQIVQGLEYLSEKNIIHRDLKFDNILCHFPEFEGKGIVPDEYIQNLDITVNNLEIIIGDFGFSRFLAEGEKTESI